MKKISIGHEISLEVEEDENGNKKFFQTLPCGNRIEFKTYKDHLFDALSSLLFPLYNLRDILDPPGEEAGPLHRLFDELLENLSFDLKSFCDLLEDKFGEIEMYSSKNGIHGVIKVGALFDISCKGKE